MTNFDENLVLETKHLYLRYLMLEDRESIFENINHDKDVLKYYVDKYYEKIEDFDLDTMILRYKVSRRYIFSIVSKETDEALGLIFQINNPDQIMNNVEIGFALGKKYWNKGYMSEALEKMIEFLFKCGVHKVWACHIEENKASGKVMEKCHMTYEGRRFAEIYYQGRYWDTLNYYILNEKQP